MIRRDIRTVYYYILVHIIKFPRQNAGYAVILSTCLNFADLPGSMWEGETLEGRVFMSPGPHFNLDSRSIISCMWTLHDWVTQLFTTSTDPNLTKKF